MGTASFFWSARPSETAVCGLKSRTKIPKIGKMFCQAEEIGLKAPFVSIKKWGLCQMVLMTSKTSLQKWSEVFLFPSVSPAFFQIVTVTYQHACFSAGVDSWMNFCH
ncbi:hypothetical protein [Ligilactobacillus ruminis]|uniref:hypothetical protein n=1 Tax=Ligilactobacillus ruminis TaxID=1623 RepID=UPI00062CBC49|nr:hypothetical protein [Ligilactobacillus ruminis]